MTEPIYLTLTGKNQDLISAGCSTIDSIGNRHQIGHEDEIQVISLNSGSFCSQNAAYQPVVFAKLIDKSSPLLSTALDTRLYLFFIASVNMGSLKNIMRLSFRAFL